MDLNPSCDPGFYKDATSSKCTACGSNAYLCTNATYALSCSNGHRLDKGVCKACPSGAYECKLESNNVVSV